MPPSNVKFISTVNRRVKYHNSDPINSILPGKKLRVGID